jgi:GNAT superfamily N-acetyltransferase
MGSENVAALSLMTSFDLHILKVGDHRYDGLTFSTYTPLLDDPIAILIGVEMRGQPIGLAIAYPDPHENRTRLLSVYVRPEHRRRGIGTELVKAVEQETIEQSDNWIDTAYIAPKEGLERVLARCGWEAPTLQLQILEAPFASLKPRIETLNPPPLLPNVKLFSWLERTEEDEAQALVLQQSIGSALHPLVDLPLLQAGSTAVRVDKELVGWALLHELNPQLVRCTALYVIPEVRDGALWQHLIRTTFLNQMAVKPYPRMVIPAARSMARFLHRSIASEITNQQEFRVCRKRLILD